MLLKLKIFSRILKVVSGKGENVRLAMESSREGEEIIKFELRVCDTDVMNILRVISECVSESYSYESQKVIEEKLIENVGEQLENDSNDNPLHRAQKLGFTYLYPWDKTTTL